MESAQFYRCQFHGKVPIPMTVNWYIPIYHAMKLHMPDVNTAMNNFRVNGVTLNLITINDLTL